LKSPTNPKSNITKSKAWPLVAIIVSVAVIVGLLWVGMTLFKSSTANHAEEVAKPLEVALNKSGATKQCSRGDRGWGGDNTMPWYDAIYEVPGNRETATELLHKAAKESGYVLTQGKLPPSPEDNKFLEDRTSKKSAYSDLVDGNIVLTITIYGSHTFTGAGDQFCTVTKRDNPPTDKTTIQFTINMPEVKR